MTYSRLTRDQIAKRVAQDIPEGSYVNLGIGLPTVIANHLEAGKEIFLHSENGILGLGPAPAAGDEESGDLANWHTGAVDAIPAVGGAMDLAIGAKRVFVTMEHLTKSGESKIVEQWTYPLTGIGCVNRIYTDLAVIEVSPSGLTVIDIVPGLSFEKLQQLTAAKLVNGVN